MTEPLMHRIGECILDLERGTLHRGGNVVLLRPKTFALLRFLAQNHGRVVAKDELMDAVWLRTTVSEDSLTQCTQDAHKSIGDGPIRTVPGRGYLMEPDTAASDPPPPSGAEDPGPPRPARPSIAILPFAGSGGSADESLLSAGIAEDIITGLTRFRSLFAIARSSSFAFRGQPVDGAEIARRLGVVHLLKAACAAPANRLRIAAHLVEAASGVHLWSEHYDRDFTDIFAVQDEVAARIVSSLAGRPEEEHFQHSLRKPAPALAAYEYLLQSQVQFRGYAAEANRRACDLFEKAIAGDPAHARVHACLAQARLALHGCRAVRYAAVKDACRIARHAVELDPLDDACYRALGHVLLYQRDHGTAEHHARRSIELNPNDADAAMSLGYLLVQRDRPAEGLTAIETRSASTPTADLAACGQRGATAANCCPPAPCPAGADPWSGAPGEIPAHRAGQRLDVSAAVFSRNGDPADPSCRSRGRLCYPRHRSPKMPWRWQRRRDRFCVGLPKQPVYDHGWNRRAAAPHPAVLRQLARFFWGNVIS